MKKMALLKKVKIYPIGHSNIKVYVILVRKFSGLDEVTELSS